MFCLFSASVKIDGKTPDVLSLLQSKMSRIPTHVRYLCFLNINIGHVGILPFLQLQKTFGQLHVLARLLFKSKQDAQMFGLFFCPKRD